MEKNKLDTYALTASIHTINVRSAAQPHTSYMVADNVLYTRYLPKADVWSTVVNPNKLHGDIFSYSEFYATVHDLFNRLNVPDFKYYRTDIRLDSYEDNFKDYYKLNSLLIGLFGLLFNDPNKQAIGHILIHSKELSDISTANQYWEVKYYNKKFQTNDTDPAKARLEFRSLKSTNARGHPPHEVKHMWFKKLDELPKLYNELQSRSNADLYKAYQEHCNYNSKGASRKDYLTNFLSSYNNGIAVYTRKQLIEFLQMCGLPKQTAEYRADNIIEKVHMEFFSKADIERYIAKIKNAMDNFFDC